MYTGVQIYQDLKRQLSQYESDVVVPSMGNYLLKKALYETIEENYKNLIIQKNKDEVGSLLKTEREYLIYDNGLCVGQVPLATVTATVNGYTITFLWNHHLGDGVSITLQSILGTIDANGAYTYTTSLTGAGQYIIVNPTTITIQIAAPPAGVYTPNTGYMTNSNMVADYLHLLEASLVFEQSTNFTLTDAKYTTPILIEVAQTNNLRTSEKVKISGVGGNTNANGTHFIRKQKSKTALLYSDKTLSTAVVGNGTYTSGGTLVRIVESVTKPMNSDEKADYYKPTIETPKLETTEKQLMVYPKNEGCVSIKMDYLTIETKELVSTSTIDYEQFYNRTFLDKVINKAAQNFTLMVQNPTEYQMITAQINQNTNAIS
jgi:hypothetical protein